MAQIKQAHLKVRGMNRDLSVSAFNPEYSYENMNIRITPRETNTLFTIENERGNSKIVSPFIDYDSNVSINNFVPNSFTLTYPKESESVIPSLTTNYMWYYFAKSRYMFTF